MARDDPERQWREDDALQRKNRALCPHQTENAIQHCPLYVESHNARGLGCVDDMARPCLVVRGEIDFASAVERVRAIDPRLVAGCEFSGDALRSRGQHTRNMRAAGIH